MQTKYPFVTSTNDLQETMLMLGVIVTKKCSLNLVCNESEVWGILKSITPCTPHYPNVKLITHSCSAHEVLSTPRERFCAGKPIEICY